MGWGPKLGDPKTGCGAGGASKGSKVAWVPLGWSRFLDARRPILVLQQTIRSRFVDRCDSEVFSTHNGCRVTWMHGVYEKIGNASNGACLSLLLFFSHLFSVQIFHVFLSSPFCLRVLLFLSGPSSAIHGATNWRRTEGML